MCQPPKIFQNLQKERVKPFILVSTQLLATIFCYLLVFVIYPKKINAVLGDSVLNVMFSCDSV